jgi:heptaprenyl diphosphate synthase
MRSPDNLDPKRLARLSLLTALAAAAQAFESLIPTPVPWFRLGLGNAFVLASLQLWGPVEGTWVALGKVFLGSLLSGRLLSPGFFLALTGTCLSTAVMAAGLRLAPPLGFVGVSALGAEAHVLGQLAVASAVFVQTPALWSLAPILGALALVSGCVTGFVAFKLAEALEDVPEASPAPPA